MLWRSDPIPQDPFVYRNDLCQELRTKIADTFLGLKDQPGAKNFLDNVKSNTFVPMMSKDYDIIRKLKAAKDAEEEVRLIRRTPCGVRLATRRTPHAPRGRSPCRSSRCAS